MLKREETKKYFGYNVAVDAIEYPGEPEEEGDTWGEQWDHIISDEITKATEGEVPDIVSSCEFSIGETVYFVYAIWSFGDSNGWANRKGFGPIAIFKNEEDAKQFSEALEDADIEKPFQYKTSDGQEFYCETLWWSDFFTSVETVDYKPLILVDTIKKEEIR